MQRFSQQLHSCGPPSWRYLFVSKIDVDAAKLLLSAASTGSDDGERLRASRLVTAVCHPDTGIPIAAPLRMAAHVPVNTLLLLAMLGAQSPATVALSQAANAAFNLLQFSANRNASNILSPGELVGSFGLAAAASVAVGYSLRSAVDRAALAATASPRFVFIGRSAVPFLAAAAGKPPQIGILRNDEWRAGVAVFDADGECRGRSVIAGRTAVAQTIACRVVYLAPMLWLPFLRGAMESYWPVLARSRAAGSMAFAGVVAAHSAFVTPAAMAVWDASARLPVEALESSLRGLRDSRGAAVTELYFNKGL